MSMQKDSGNQNCFIDVLGFFFGGHLIKKKWNTMHIIKLQRHLSILWCILMVHLGIIEICLSIWGFPLDITRVPWGNKGWTKYSPGVSRFITFSFGYSFGDLHYPPYALLNDIKSHFIMHQCIEFYLFLKVEDCF